MKPAPRRHRHIVGLTGGIGSGKSTVASMLANCGATVVDADRVARSLTEPGGAAMPAIRAVFGDAVLTATGALNREAMRQQVFAQPTARAQLEAIIHPLVAQGMAAALHQAPAGGVVVLDIPLLVESPRWRNQLDRVVVVDCQPSTQISRVVQRNGWPEATVQAVIQTQASRSTRLKAADVVIFNEELTLSALNSEVQALGQWLGL